MEKTNEEIQQSITNYSTQQREFLVNIMKKVTYLDWKFSYDFICIPTEEQVQKINAGEITHHMRINIQHFGVDTDPGKGDDSHWLTYCGYVEIKEWNEKAILEAIFITLIQKLRHEASETFKVDGEFMFHEHKGKNIVIPE